MQKAMEGFYLEGIKRNDTNTNPRMEAVEVRDATFVVVFEGCADSPDPKSQSNGMEDKVDQLLHWFLQGK